MKRGFLFSGHKHPVSQECNPQGQGGGPHPAAREQRYQGQDQEQEGHSENQGHRPAHYKMRSRQDQGDAQQKKGLSHPSLSVDVGQQGQDTGFLDLLGQHSLVLSGSTGDAAGNNLA